MFTIFFLFQKVDVGTVAFRINGERVGKVKCKVKVGVDVGEIMVFFLSSSSSSLSYIRTVRASEDGDTFCYSFHSRFKSPGVYCFILALVKENER